MIHLSFPFSEHSGEPGDKDEKVKASLKDAELLQQFKAVEQFTDDDKSVVKKLIDAFIVKKQLQQMAS